MTELDDFDEVMPPTEVGLFMMVIGDRADLSKSKARTAGKSWRVALQHYPGAVFDWSVSGYDDDPREIWQIPEVVRFVRWWAHYTGLDDLETARRVFGSDPYMCMGGLAMCGVFGEEVKQQVVFTPRGQKMRSVTAADRHRTAIVALFAEQDKIPDAALNVMCNRIEALPSSDPLSCVKAIVAETLKFPGTTEETRFAILTEMENGGYEAITYVDGCKNT